MKNLNDEYYLIFKDPSEKFMTVDIHTKSSNRRFRGVKLEAGEPLFFEPGFKELLAKKNIQAVKSDIMFDGGSILLDDKVKKTIEHFKLTGMRYYPSVLIENDDVWDESYWYLNIWQRLDCWDRDLSIHRPLKPGRDEDSVMIKKYSLDPLVLNQIPEEKRLLFRMGNEGRGEIFMHRKLVDVLQQKRFTGVRFFKVSNFKNGDQY